VTLIFVQLFNQTPAFPHVLPELDNLQELRVMLAERLEEWAHGYEAKGMQQGMQQGEGAFLRRLLTRRFGALPNIIETSLAEAGIDQLEIWGDRILDAKSLGDVFDVFNPDIA